MNGKIVCSGEGCWWATVRQASVLCLYSPPPHLLPPEHCNYGSVTTLDWVLLTDRTRLNLSLSPAPRAEPGKTRGAWSPVAG